MSRRPARPAGRTPQCFNGAAPLKTRKYQQGRQAYVPTVRLQWGRVFEDAEIWLRRAGQDPLARVSIHARARRATVRIRCLASAPAGFNPRPRAAGDCGYKIFVSPEYRFQSTPARGGRRHLLPAMKLSKIVSIHARARRATTEESGGRHADPVSIHARARRATDT